MKRGQKKKKKKIKNGKEQKEKEEKRGGRVEDTFGGNFEKVQWLALGRT